jgi:putative transposase
VVPMKSSAVYRKTRKAWSEPGQSHFLTFSTLDKRPYLRDDRICSLLAKKINEAGIKHQFVVLAYVFMPTHVHLLIHPVAVDYDFSKILASIKIGTSKIARSKGWIDTRLWKAGGGYDRSVTNQRERLEIITYIHLNAVRKEIVSDALEYPWSSANWFHTGVPSEVDCVAMGELSA